MILQSSQLSCFYECPRKWVYQYGRMRTRPPSMAMEAGSTFHNLCENHLKKGIPLESLYDSLDENRQEFYEVIFPVFLGWLKKDEKSGYITHTINGEKAIEVEFSIQLSPNVEYRGKVDRIAEKSGSLYFLDWKYTSSYLSDSFFNKFEISPQVLSYSYLGKTVFPGLDGFIIDAASRTKSGTVAYEKRYFPLLPVMDEFMGEVLAIAEFMEENLDNEEAFFHNRCSCMTKYNSRCLFYDVCLTKPSSRERILMSDLYVTNQLIYDEEKKPDAISC